ncbi:hypothetical protein KIPB_003175 [Kipferlia bialata]|uniref:Uncharacterized protein n=1 Tax=Kipferlia bialata TaxID=797122 RepID=A0A9K3GGH7_9EUKA|nr:hypothetical protein KIPB_003175 [Kipferlia bialata]|eukprot:g3175.t1
MSDHAISLSTLGFQALRNSRRVRDFLEAFLEGKAHDYAAGAGSTWTQIRSTDLLNVVVTELSAEAQTVHTPTDAFDSFVAFVSQQDNYVGVAAGAYYAEQTARVEVVGATCDKYRNLVPGHRYYVEYDGTVSEVSGERGLVYHSMGIALTQTKLLIK